MTKHTPEPWRIKYRVNVVANRDGQEASVFTLYSRVNAEKVARENEANADRAVACVNALAGIADPAKFVAYAKAAIAAIELWNNPDAKEDDVLDALTIAAEAKPKQETGGRNELATD